MTAAVCCELVGGPFDGRKIAKRAAAFIWVTVAADSYRTIRVWPEPGADRLLYRRIDSGYFLYAEHLFRRCDACGQVSTPQESGACRKCGEKLPAA